ncbi:MAG TPA: S26 family signal peptidase [Flavitalea sp.]|nr:S26 family signal peptidase [Flavitalea sp.]
MSSHDLTVLILISILLVLLPAPGLYKMFQKAGMPAWKAWVPFLNTWEIVKVSGIRKHWFFWQFIPVAGWFISIWLLIEFVKLFGKFRLYEHALTVFVPFLYFPYIGYNQKDRFIGREGVRKHKKSAAREWIDAAVFAIVAATLIRTFIFEAYTIPTGSMEKTLLVNDFLFVSKLSYGPRIPNTPLAVPFVHHTVPLFNTKSYSELIHIPYTRWFASPVKRNDVVVFNFPAGDTLTKEKDSQDPYYDILRRSEMESFIQMRGQIKNDTQLIALSKERAREDVWTNYTVTTRPVDKRENYIKRCVGISGDSLEVKENVVYINGKEQPLPPRSQARYLVVTNGALMDPDVMHEEYNLDADKDDYRPSGKPNEYYMLLTGEAKAKMLKNGFAKSISMDYTYNMGGGPVYPYDTAFKWTRENFGPIWIPQKGKTITLDAKNFSLYERVIRVYEGNELEKRNGVFFINGVAATTYTFKMNYYWMMGDNRQDSQDSRFWGFVPEDHVVGEAWLIWMSWDGGIRWNRLFRTIH